MYIDQPVQRKNHRIDVRTRNIEDEDIFKDVYLTHNTNIEFDRLTTTINVHGLQRQMNASNRSLMKQCVFRVSHMSLRNRKILSQKILVRTNILVSNKRRMILDR